MVGEEGCEEELQEEEEEDWNDSWNAGCPAYVVNLLQFWINRMTNTATQSRIKNCVPSPAVRAKHFFTCSYNDLVHLSHHLRGIKTESYTTESARKTDGSGGTAVC